MAKTPKTPRPAPTRTTTTTTTPVTVAFSYLRFSDPVQSDGDSVRRQTDLRSRWLDRHPDVRLDTTVKLADEGVSAYRGRHRTNPRHALAQFLDLVNRGRIPTGSILLIENMDRLSREKPVVASHLLTGILLAGIRIIQLAPDEIELTEDSDLFTLFRGQHSQSVGHQESTKKEFRNGEAWAAKKEAARSGKPQPRLPHGTLEGTMLLTRMLPAWCEARGGVPVLIPERAAAVRRVFALSAAGYGNARIVGRLHQEGVPPFTASGRWTTSYVGTILRDRRALGEFQPRTVAGRPDGAPIPGYLPAVVTADEFEAGRNAAVERTRKRGAVGAHVNVFAGLTKDARTGESYFSCLRVDEGGRRMVLINFASTQRRDHCYAFPAETFERAVLGCLREVDPHDVLNGDDPPDETGLLAKRLETLVRYVEVIEKDCDEHGETPARLDRLQKRCDERDRVRAQLEEARHRERHPLSETWGEAAGLIEMLDEAPDPEDLRTRLRTALRRIIDTIVLLVVPRGRDRLAAVQVNFRRDSGAGTVRRDYLVWHRGPHGNARARKAGWWRVCSWRAEDVARWLPVPALTEVETDEPWTTEAFLTAVKEDVLDRLLFAGCAAHPLP